MEAESRITQSIIDKIDSSNIEGDQVEGASGFTRSIIDEPLFGIWKEIKWQVKVVLLEVSSMNFILGLSKEIKGKVKVVLLEGSSSNFILEIFKGMKWKVKVVLLEVSSMNFILRISKNIKWKVKAWCYSKYHR